ncbi:MAG TPA: restriction endonuclease [Chthonomonadaceae bacterium]|nr:restriction endonuclease [Chthonomonadaceae bacterium]
MTRRESRFLQLLGRATAPPDVRRACLWAAVFMLGLAARLGGSAVGRGLGWAAMSLGIVGLAGWLWKAWRFWQEQQAVEAARARRAALRASRRERDARERARRQARRAAKAAAVARLAEARAQQQSAAQQQARQEAARRAAWETAIEAEVARLQTLSDDELAAEVEALFARRGLRPVRADTEAPGDWQLVAETGETVAVARCVPVRRVAGAVDVRELEAWRQAAGAQCAYLIALAGFTPAAVERVRDLPMKLVEAHLLAHWRLAPAGG